MFCLARNVQQRLAVWRPQGTLSTAFEQELNDMGFPLCHRERKCVYHPFV
jgi:hypothetical protein